MSKKSPIATVRAPRERRRLVKPRFQGRLRVLVADDDADAVDSLCILIKLWGHDVQPAYGGITALDLASAYRPHVLILDLVMPTLDGCNLAHLLRRSAGFRDTLLIAITGYPDEEYRLLCADAGFDVVLVKPVAPATLQKLLMLEEKRLAKLPERGRRINATDRSDKTLMQPGTQRQGPTPTRVQRDGVGQSIRNDGAQLQRPNGHPTNGQAPPWHASFLPLLTIIRREVRSSFQHLPRQDRADALAEVTAMVLVDYIALLQGDRPVALDPTALVRAAAWNVLKSERACGPESSYDVLSPTAQQQRRFTVGHLTQCAEERLQARIDLRQPWPKPAQEQRLESRMPGAGWDGALRFDQERQRRRKAERRVRRTALELLAARHIQQKLFPAASPVLPGLEVGGIARPAEATGGDYFDYVPMLDEGVGIVVGDVSGHGFGPALLMASTRAYMRAFAQTHSDLGELLSLVNRVMGLDMEDNRFVTLILARFDPRTKSLAYVSAGHPTGYVLDASGQVRVCLPSTGLPLGIGNESYSASAVIPLQPGELVILLSDGVTEATAPDGAAFGWERAVSIARVYRDDPPPLIVANLYNAVRAFSQNAPPLDDITAVVIKIKQDSQAPDMKYTAKGDSRPLKEIIGS